MSRVLYLRHSGEGVAEIVISGMTTPLPWIGSTMNAAISLVANARSNASRFVERIRGNEAAADRTRAKTSSPFTDSDPLGSTRGTHARNRRFPGGPSGTGKLQRRLHRLGFRIGEEHLSGRARDATSALQEHGEHDTSI